MKRSLFAVLALVAATQVFAQTAPQPDNPLRPRRIAPPAAQQQPVTPAPQAATPATPDTAAKPKRARSEKQLKNDQAMRDCGADWKANKAQLAAQGKTWRTFMPECRKQKLGEADTAPAPVRRAPRAPRST